MHNEIKKAIEVLRAGGVILYPTDTVWGIGCDATNEAAVKRVFEIKKRIESKPMLVLVDAPGRIQSYVDEVPDMAWELMELADKPLTIIYSGAKNMALALMGEEKTVGIRVTNEEFSRKLCAQFRRPVVSTSANKSGEPTPANFSQISDDIKSAVDYVVDYRQHEMAKAQPSSVIRLGKGNLIQIIR